MKKKMFLQKKVIINNEMTKINKQSQPTWHKVIGHYNMMQTFEFLNFQMLQTLQSFAILWAVEKGSTCTSNPDS